MPNQKPMDARERALVIIGLVFGSTNREGKLLRNPEKEIAAELESVRLEEREACAKVFDGAITLLEKLAQHGGPATVRDLRLLKEWQEKIRSRGEA